MICHMKPQNLHMLLQALLTLQLLVSCSGQSQNTNQTTERKPANTNVKVGGPCEACDLIYFGMPQQISNTDTTIGWSEKGQKLIVSGTVFQLDGKTPAPNVIVYFYHTDNDGYY